MSERSEAIALLRDAVPSLWQKLRLLPWLLILPFCIRSTGRIAKLHRGVDGLVCIGGCLRPWIVHGEMVMFDRALEARDNDLVVTKTHFTMRAGLGQACREVAVGGAKQLRVDPSGKRWLCSADGAYWADDPEGGHEIVGVVVSAARRPWRKPPPLAGIGFPIRPVAA